MPCNCEDNHEYAYISQTVCAALGIEQGKYMIKPNDFDILGGFYMEMFRYYCRNQEETTYPGDSSLDSFPLYTFVKNNGMLDSLWSQAKHRISIYVLTTDIPLTYDTTVINDFKIPIELISSNPDEVKARGLGYM